MRGLRQRQELARARAEQKASGAARQPRLTRLAPGQHLETRGVLAGAYRGRDIGERELLTHAVLVEGVRPGHDVRTLCSQPVEHVADTFSVRLEYDLDEAPTCQTCLPRWERLKEKEKEDLQRKREMRNNGSALPDAEENERLDDLTAYCSTLLSRLHGDELDAALEGEARRRGQSDSDFRNRALQSVHPDDMVTALSRRGINLSRFGIREIRREHTPNSERRYYVWVLLPNNEPKDEGPYGPYEFLEAKSFARIGATEGAHDRAVSIGVDPSAHSFQIVRQYRRGTGERVQ